MSTMALKRAGSKVKKIGKIFTIVTIAEAALIGFGMLAAFIIIIAAL